MFLVDNKEEFVNKEQIYPIAFMKENSQYITMVKSIEEETTIEYDKQIINEEGKSSIEKYVLVETQLEVIGQSKGDIQENNITFVNYNGPKLEKENMNYPNLNKDECYVIFMTIDNSKYYPTYGLQSVFIYNEEKDRYINNYGDTIIVEIE
jgi:hypothetical protein